MGEEEEALKHPTLSFAESRNEPSITTEGTELVKEVVYELLNSVEHHCDEQLLTCSISTAYSFASTVKFEI